MCQNRSFLSLEGQNDRFDPKIGQNEENRLAWPKSMILCSETPNSASQSAEFHVF